MADFTQLLNRGHRRYIDKYLKKRDFGRCEVCDTRALLVKPTQKIDGDSVDWKLCNRCYDKFVREEGGS